MRWHSYYSTSNDNLQHSFEQQELFRERPPKRTTSPAITAGNGQFWGDLRGSHLLAHTEKSSPLKIISLLPERLLMYLLCTFLVSSTSGYSY